MRTGHVGAEYVEYVRRHKRRLVAAPAPIRRGNPEFDAMSVREPDLAVYDDIGAARALLDSGEPLSPTSGTEDAS